MEELITLNQLKEYDEEKTNKIDARFNNAYNYVDNGLNELNGYVNDGFNVVNLNVANLASNLADNFNTVNNQINNAYNYVNNGFNEIHNNLSVANLAATNATITDLNVTNAIVNGYNVLTENNVTDTVALDDSRVITSGAVYNAIANSAVSFDNTPTTGSTNAVTSEGILNYVDNQVTLAITQVLNTGF